MKIKTYGVPNLTEWHGKLKAGSIEVQVSFTGGTSSPSGAQPAYFVTKDPITQFIVENSKEFKNGTIIQVMSQDVAGNHPRMAIPKPKATKIVKAEEPKVAEVPAATEIAETPEVEADAEAVGTEPKIEVNCLQDAQAYLQEKFGISSYKVRTCEAAQRAASEHGVRFTGAKFDALNESKPADVTAEETE